MEQSMVYADNCYSIPNISVRGQLCKTNLAPNTAMRGAGTPQSILICEHWMTKVADFLKQPPHKVMQLLWLFRLKTVCMYACIFVWSID